MVKPEQDEPEGDAGRALMLDGNAVAGLLVELFGAEMTASPTECAHCGHGSAVGELLAYGEGPGVVLRCPTCQDIVLRIAVTPGAFYLDARGAVYLRISR
ncbi:MAG: DUF6510 family protein [Anaerolineae bacterium]